MNKFVVALVAMFAVSAATAADLSSVGSSGFEVNSASVFDTEGKVGLSNATLGGQLNFGDKGSVAIDVGIVRSEDSWKQEAVTLSYANGAKVGPIKLVGVGSYSRIDVTSNGGNAGNIVAVGAEAQMPSFLGFKPFVGIAETHVFTNTDGATAGGLSTSYTGGAYFKLGPIVTKVGYVHGWSPELGKDNAVTASFSVKF